MRRKLTSSTLSAPTSVSSTRVTHVWCLKCSSRTFTISWSTVSSAHCLWGTSAPSCSRWPRPWWSWRAWVSSTLIWSLRTSCWWTPSDSPTGWRSSTLGQPVTSPKPSARLTSSLATTGDRLSVICTCLMITHPFSRDYIPRLWDYVVVITRLNPFSAFYPQSPWDHPWSAVLWSHWHVVTGLCDCRALSGLAVISRSFRIWPGLTCCYCYYQKKN